MGNLKGIVFVALNYRLGAFGWLSGQDFEKDGVANAGLRDQRMAFEWVYNYIHRFGGDRDRVTVIGESAGAGSIMHHLTVLGEPGSPLFQQAIAQSPAWPPYPSKQVQNIALQGFLDNANVSSIAEARNLSSQALLTANAAQISTAMPYAPPVWGPAVDGSFVQEDPKKRLSARKFNASLKVVAAHNSDEGLILAPVVEDNNGYIGFLRRLLTKSNSSVIDYIADELYPPLFDGSMGYRSNYERAALTAGEAVVTCNANALGFSYDQHAYSYVFRVFPGVHGQDINYTFYNSDKPPSASPILGNPNQTLAYVMQDYIAKFSEYGIMESPLDGLSTTSAYGQNANAVQLQTDGVRIAKDPGANYRCRWWQLVQYN